MTHDFRTLAGIMAAEWSEEDRKMLDAIIKRYEFAVESDCAVFIKTDKLTQMEKELAWLKSLRSKSITL